jgi:hypothetical protein
MWKKQGFSRPRPQRDEKKQYVITEKYIRDICEYNKQYTSPKLNDKLYLNQVGFAKIQCLEKYVNLKSLHLSNSFTN